MKKNINLCRKCKIKKIAEKYRPFCSERCKLLDFDEWITEKKII